jgi:hypothetical protein
MEDAATFVEELTWKDRFRFGVEQVKEMVPPTTAKNSPTIT